MTLGGGVYSSVLDGGNGVGDCGGGGVTTSNDIFLGAVAVVVMMMGAV